MDPVSIVMITNASFAIARSLIHTIKELYEIAEAYETAALGIRTVASQCTSFRIAIERINKWLPTQNEDSRHNLDEDFWQALKSNLDTGALVVEDLDKRIQGLKKSPSRFRTRTKYLWNNVVISDLQSQIQGLMSALGLLITVIDLPIAKRSLSRAQSTKLNDLTQTARRRYESRRGRGDTKLSEEALSETTKSTSDADFTAPPPYVASPESKTVAANGDAESKFSPSPEPTLLASIQKDSLPDKVEAEVDENGKVPKKKNSRPSWMRFGKRSSNKAEKLQSSSDDFSLPTESKDELDTTPKVLLTSEIDQNQMQATPAAIESLEKQDNYFTTKDATLNVSPPSTMAIQPLASPEAIDEANQARLVPSNPYLALRLGRTQSESDFTNTPRSTYELTKVPSETASEMFDRIRPSQRVQAQQARSNSQGLGSSQNSGVVSPTLSDHPAPSKRPSAGGSRLGSLSSSFSDDLGQQTWATTAINNRRIKFKVKFETEKFTNRMSASAARALGVDQSIIVFDQTPLASLTLLHAVTDNIGGEDQEVNGDEVEFVVMDEWESRVPELFVGAGFAHFARLMEGGEYIYWSPGPVPENLRTADKLRLYKRFELTMW